jgi:hypothetical protein
MEKHGGWGTAQWPNPENFKGKNNGRQELFRVRDARAALPQNCSKTKLNICSAIAYGTSVPADAQTRLPHLLEIPAVLASQPSGITVFVKWL